jgi:DDE superfamily endonuclease
MKGGLFLGRIGLPSSNLQKQATGYVSCHRIHQSRNNAAVRDYRIYRAGARNAPVAPGPRIAPLLVAALSEFVPTADDLGDGTYYIVDGTLLPRWKRRAHPELRSGKHRATGLKALLACTLSGRLAWISGPVTGNHHDMYCLKESGLLDGTDTSAFSGDTGFVGSGMLTPIRKPRHRELLEWEKEINTAIARFRRVTEQVIANFKTWPIMHTDYRRPLETFPEAISAVAALHFYRSA